MIQNHVKNHELVFSSSAKWSRPYSTYLLHYLMSKGNDYQVTSKSITDIGQHFYHTFDKDFLIRRCEAWGYIYSIKK